METSRPFAVLVIDLHTVFHKVIPDYPTVLRRCRFLMEAAHTLGIEVWLTRHYPDKLGPLDEAVCPPAAHRILDKDGFSAFDALRDRLNDPGGTARQWVVCGVETHVCVWQTVRDMRRHGWDVSVLVDAVGSRRRVDHDAALQRMAASGAVWSTTETTVFEWLGSPRHPAFKDISALVKDCDERQRDGG